MLVAPLAERAPGSVTLGAIFPVGDRFEADLIVGCDGLRSRVRTGLFGEEQPRFTQIVALRGLVPMKDVPAECASSRPAFTSAMATSHITRCRRNGCSQFRGRRWLGGGRLGDRIEGEMDVRFAHFHPTLRAAMRRLAGLSPDNHARHIECFRLGAIAGLVAQPDVLKIGQRANAAREHLALPTDLAKDGSVDCGGVLQA